MTHNEEAIIVFLSFNKNIEDNPFKTLEYIYAICIHSYNRQHEYDFTILGWDIYSNKIECVTLSVE